MKKLLITLAVLALAIPAQAQVDYNGFEASVQFFETVDGRFSPGMKIATTNYVDGKGLGVFLGENDALGPLFVWRVFDMWFSPEFGMAVHLGANTDLGIPGTEIEKPKNIAYMFEPRFKWSGLKGKTELGALVQIVTIEGMEREWTFGITLNFFPGGKIVN